MTSFHTWISYKSDLGSSQSSRTLTRKKSLRRLRNFWIVLGLLDKKHSFARQLSGGQKQRVAIVRSLLMHPEVILFDEVTASLDPEMVREVLELINDLAQEGRTMLIVTHELQFARAIADRISLWIRESSLRKVLLKNSSIIRDTAGSRVPQCL